MSTSHLLKLVNHVLLRKSVVIQFEYLRQQSKILQLLHLVIIE